MKPSPVETVLSLVALHRVVASSTGADPDIHHQLRFAVGVFLLSSRYWNKGLTNQ
jgi:hypothetical protein